MIIPIGSDSKQRYYKFDSEDERKAFNKYWGWNL